MQQTLVHLEVQQVQGVHQEEQRVQVQRVRWWTGRVEAPGTTTAAADLGGGCPGAPVPAVHAGLGF